MSPIEVLDFVEIGQVITVYKEGIPVMELPVLSKAAIISDDMEIGFTSSGPTKVGGDGPFLYLPTNIYRQLYDHPTAYKYSFNVEEDKQAEMAAFLEAYMANEDIDMAYLSSESARKSAMNTRRIVNLVGGLIGAIFGISGVLNLTNTIITTILTRRRELATMQSIGMTGRQLTRMMVFEGLYYAAGACVLGLAVSALLCLTLVRDILSSPSMWYCTFHFTLLPALAVSALLLMMSAIVPVLALHLFNRGSIVEQMGRE